MKVFAITKNGERLSELGFFFDYGHARLALQIHVQHGNPYSKYPDSFGIEESDLSTLNPPHKSAINWEQRRWELAQKLYFWSEFQGHWKDAIEQAGILIEQYKQTLNTEE